MSLAAFLGKVDGYQATPELSRVSGVFRDGFRTFPIIFEYSGTPNIVRLDQIGLDITTDSLYAMVLEILEIPRNPTIKKKHAYIKPYVRSSAFDMFYSVMDIFDF